MYHSYLFHVSCNSYYDLKFLSKYIRASLPYIPMWVPMNLKAAWEDYPEEAYPVYVYVSGDESEKKYYLCEVYKERPEFEGSKVVSQDEFLLNVLGSKLLEMYEPIVSYGNGKFRNMPGNDTRGYNELAKTFPDYKELMYDYNYTVKEYCKNKVHNKEESTEIIPLPPFVVFPTYSSTTIGWRM